LRGKIQNKLSEKQRKVFADPTQKHIFQWRMARKWLNTATVILSTASAVFFAVGCFSGYSGDKAMMKGFPWMRAFESGRDFTSDYYFSLKGVRVESHWSDIPSRQTDFADSACIATYCDICNMTGSAAYLVNIVASVVCAIVAVKSGTSIKSYSKSTQIANATMALGVAVVSAASTFSYLILCCNAVAEEADRRDQLDDLSAPHPYWEFGAIMAICGTGIMLLVAVLQVSAACLDGPSRKLVPLPAVELDLPTQQVSKQDVHYA
jgi:hypothetical protein